MEGASNYVIWKERISFLLDEHNIKTYVNNMVAIPENPDPLKKYKDKMAKAKRLILDGVRNHIVCYISRNDTSE